MENEAFKGRIAGVIVGGDFNTNHDGQFGDNVVKMMTEAGFVNTWRTTPRKDRHTWRGSNRYEPTTFDHIFLRGLEASTAELVEVSEDTSDHWPVRVEISLP
jgi:endonuclease/exonuclease/phosphatase (EEP) superfamily protein YafD